MGRVAVVTLTGGCPDAFPLISKYVHRQTRTPDLWIVSDDSEERTKHNKRGLAKNMVRALKRVPEGYDIVVMEDDDWYPPEYVEVMARALDGSDGLVGPTHISHYHVGGRRWMENEAPIKKGVKHTALAFTGIPAHQKDQAARLFKRVKGGACLPLWKAIGGDLALGCLGIGIKGIPGSGVSAKHRLEGSASAGWTKDPDMSKLREWIGEDAKEYEKYGA